MQIAIVFVYHSAMAGPLRNARHEAFCRGLFENKSASDAFIAAGYKPSRHNAHRLSTKEHIQSRLAELQSEAAQASAVTVESLLRELEHARKRADSLDQLAASVKAIEAKAKVSGLLTQKITVEHSDKAFADADTPEQIAERYAWYYDDRHIELTAEERKEFGRLMQDAVDGFENFLDRCKAAKAKVVPALPARPLVDMERVERKRLGLVNRSNS